LSFYTSAATDLRMHSDAYQGISTLKRPSNIHRARIPCFLIYKYALSLSMCLTMHILQPPPSARSLSLALITHTHTRTHTQTHTHTHTPFSASRQSQTKVDCETTQSLLLVQRLQQLGALPACHLRRNKPSYACRAQVCVCVCVCVCVHMLLACHVRRNKASCACGYSRTSKSLMQEVLLFIWSSNRM